MAVGKGGSGALHIPESASSWSPSVSGDELRVFRDCGGRPSIGWVRPDVPSLTQSYLAKFEVG